MPSWVPKARTILDDIAAEEMRREQLTLEREQQREWAQPLTRLPGVEGVQGPSEMAALVPTYEPSDTYQWQTPQPSMADMPEITRPMQFAPIAAPEAPPEPLQQATGQAIQWWKQPKAVTEKAMVGVGKVISKVPVLPKALEFVAPAFEWIHSNLEKPWGALTVGQFAPEISWRSGESYIEHQKRRYDIWQAPTYVKGLAEFAMPLWWIPWLGWAAKGAKSLGVGAKLLPELETVSAKTGGFLSLPSSEMLNQSFKGDFMRNMAHWAERVPVLNKVVESIGGPAAFVRDIGEVKAVLEPVTRRMTAVTEAGKVVPITDIARREIVKRAMLYDMRHGYKGLQMPRIQQFGDPKKILQMDDYGRSMAVTPKKGSEKLGRGLSEVIENPDAYLYASPQARQVVDEIRKIISELYMLASENGVPVPVRLIFHRMVEGKKLSPQALAQMAAEQGIDVDTLIKKLGDGVTEASEYGSSFVLKRHWETMEEGIIKSGLKYGNDPIKNIQATVDYYFKQIANKRFANEISKFGLKINDKIAGEAPGLLEKMADLSTRIGSAKYAELAVSKLKSYQGRSIPGATMAKIKRGLPEIAEQIDEMMSLRPATLEKELSRLSDDFWRAAKISPRDAALQVERVVHARTGIHATTRTIRLSDVQEAILNLNVNRKLAVDAVEQIYRNTYKANKQTFDTAIDTMKSGLKEIERLAREGLAPLKQDYRILAEKYRGPQVLGENEARFRYSSAFRDRIFDKGVVDMAEKVLQDKGIKWIRDMANVSGISRMLTAALDFSAPFLQGLLLFGRNPVAWGKAVAKHYQFFLHPDNLYKYLNEPAIRAIAQERWFYGGTRSSFEFFEALAPLQRGAGKIPGVGKYIQAGIQQSYGRAEAAFSGFGEVARNELWKAFRRPGMTDKELRELSKLVDRMTGVMSIEALGLGRTQQDFENAFVFFAPRYTRAGLTIAGDILRGGMRGNEARIATSSMMASGLAFYYGACTALGQQPYLDPNSAKFMTIQVGNDRIGVGGVYYALARLAANVAATAADEPAMLSPLNLSRVDNPFYKFLYSRTSPLTGFAVGTLIEQKDYLGEPFESPSDWARFLVDKVTPIALHESMPWAKGETEPVTFASEILGGRRFPKSAWELKDEARDSVAMKEHGIQYDQLDALNQKRVDSTQEVMAFQEEIDKMTTRKGDALSVSFLQRRRELDTARLNHRNQVELLSAAYEDGSIDGVQFREETDKANYGYGATYEHINNNPEYRDVMEKLTEPKDVDKKFRWEECYEELMAASTGTMFTDKYGLFQYDKYNGFMESLKVKYGEADYNRAQNMRLEKYAEYPSLFHELLKARETLKPYWQVRDEVIKMFGQQFADSNGGQTLISKLRKTKRLTNPEMNAAYMKFYSST